MSIRLFGHYVSFPLLILLLAEAAIHVGAVYLGGTIRFLEPGFQLLSADGTPIQVLPRAVLYAGVMIGVMTALGLYGSQLRVDDREYQVSARRVMKIIESTTDPRSEYFDLMRRESVPAQELMGRRMETGVVAVLAQLGAKRNWHRIMREYIYADDPETELGEQEWAYFEDRGFVRTPGLARD